MAFFSKLLGHNDLIYIHTDKQQYYTGETVTGQVILSVVQPLKMDGVVLKLSGREETELLVSRTRTRTRTAANGRSETYTETYTEKVWDEHVFFRRKYTLFSQRSLLMTGNYVFPFQFQLEANLPGTFKMKERLDKKGTVSYKVAAEVAVPGFFNPNLRHLQEILVREPLRAALMSSDTYQESKVTFLCCIPKGTVTMSASIDKNAYCPGETVVLRLQLDNSKSRVNLEAVKLKLTSLLSVRARGDQLCESNTIVQAKAAGVTAGEMVERYIQLTLPSGIEPSTTGRLITCEYTVDAVLKVPWSLDVVCKQRVQIVVPVQTSYMSTLSYPEGWHPDVYPTVDLNSIKYVSY